MITPAPQERQSMDLSTPHSGAVSDGNTSNSQRSKPVINNFYISPSAVKHDQLYAQLNKLLNTQNIDADVEKQINDLSP